METNADEFHQKYGGINVTGLGGSDEGWYVRYRHENLTYLFGPLADRELAQKKMWELETVRDAAIRNQPKLESSKVDFVHFNYSGIYGKAGDTAFTGKARKGRVRRKKRTRRRPRWRRHSQQKDDAYGRRRHPERAGW